MSFKLLCVFERYFAPYYKNMGVGGGGLISVVTNTEKRKHLNSMKMKTLGDSDPSICTITSVWSGCYQKSSYLEIILS